ncbi:MAG: hypothetical protein QNJ46_17705, partial [Leptolyngbyaceae cyanobacterium MO_188.B28]|nr:hypothetical protein [Leptolyngbyaceae cyanobacterium MO_188.B28]
MFNPTHLLVSRSKQTPVQLVRSSRGFALVTETEWRQRSQPVFELHPNTTTRLLGTGQASLAYACDGISKQNDCVVVG